MQSYPLRNYVVDITPINQRLFGWIRFEDNRNWIRLDEKPLSFLFSITKRDDSLHSWKIHFRDQLNNDIQCDIHDLEAAPTNVTDFPNLDEKHKRFFKVSISTNNKQQIFTCSVDNGDTREDVFCFSPNLSYPAFLFSACQQYLPLITHKDFPNFVETGSLFGHTSIHAGNWFDTVHSIELSTELYNELPVQWAKQRGIHFHHGSSAAKLPDIINSLCGPTVFFLDSHWSGDNTVDWNNSSFVGYPIDTAHLGGDGSPSPEQQKPIIEELELIMATFPDEALIIIDDWKLFGVKDTAFDGMDWTHISQRAVIELLDNNSRVIVHNVLDGHRYAIGLRAT